MNAAEEARQLKSQADEAARLEQKAIAEAQRKHEKEERRLGKLRAEKELPDILAKIKSSAKAGKDYLKIEIYGWRDDGHCTPNEAAYSDRLTRLLVNEEGFKVKNDFQEQYGGGGSDPLFYGTRYWYYLEITW